MVRIMNTKRSLLGISAAVLIAVSLVAIADAPSALARMDASGNPDLVAKLTPIGDTESMGKAQFWFDNDDDPSALSYQIVLNKIKLNDKNQGQGFLDKVTKIHIHEAPGGSHTDPHLFNIIGPNHDEDDRMIAGQTVQGVWDKADVRSGMPPTKPIKTGTTTFGISVLEALCTGQTDVNVHSNDFPGGVIRGILEQNSEACNSLGF